MSVCTSSRATQCLHCSDAVLLLQPQHKCQHQAWERPVHGGWARKPCAAYVPYPVARLVQHEQEGHDADGHVFTSHVTWGNQVHLHPREGLIGIFQESFSQGQEREEMSWWRKLPRKVLYNCTFGVPDQGQMLDVWESQTTESALRWWTRHIVPHHILELTLEVILEFTLEVVLELTLEVILEHVLRIKTMTSSILDHVVTAYLYLGINTGEKDMILFLVLVLESSQDWSWSIKHAPQPFLL